jgi:hypothetical protein
MGRSEGCPSGGGSHYARESYIFLIQEGVFVMSPDIMKYFGTLTAKAGAVPVFKFEYLTTLGIAAIVIFLGRFWSVKADC